MGQGVQTMSVSIPLSKNEAEKSDTTMDLKEITYRFPYMLAIKSINLCFYAPVQRFQIVAPGNGGTSSSSCKNRGGIMNLSIREVVYEPNAIIRSTWMSMVLSKWIITAIKVGCMSRK